LDGATYQWEKIGTTEGLSGRDAGSAHARPPRIGGRATSMEQGYVWSLDGSDRPVVFEAWVGWDVDARVRMTKRQARESGRLLLEAGYEETG
jgi:hypothetical protein